MATPRAGRKTASEYSATSGPLPVELGQVGRPLNDVQDQRDDPVDEHEHPVLFAARPAVENGVLLEYVDVPVHRVLHS
jgi:hypothetical protein